MGIVHLCDGPEEEVVTDYGLESWEIKVFSDCWTE